MRNCKKMCSFRATAQMTKMSFVDSDSLPEWSKGVDSSSTSASCVGSNPTAVILFSILARQLRLRRFCSWILTKSSGPHMQIILGVSDEANLQNHPPHNPLFLHVIGSLWESNSFFGETTSALEYILSWHHTFSCPRLGDRTLDEKGLRDRNSPTCTLSQNGYGENSEKKVVLPPGLTCDM